VSLKTSPTTRERARGASGRERYAVKLPGHKGVRQRRLLQVCTALLILAVLLPGAAHARPAQPYIPASFYPVGSSITFDPTYSDDSMNAAWDFDANGEPLMHSYAQSVFLRQSGWMEKSFLVRGRQIAWFILFSSDYGTFADGHLGNTEAYRDLRYMLKHWWFAKPAKHPPRDLLPTTDIGASETRIIPKLGDGPFIVMSARWGATQEVEAIAFSSPGLLTRTKMLGMLARQVRYAVRHPHPPTPSPARQERGSYFSQDLR